MSLTANDLKRRIGRITSSTAAACLGLDPKKSQIEAWLQIRGHDPAPPPESPVKQSRLMRKAIDRGNRLEPYILEYGAEYLTDDLDKTIVMTPAPFRAKEDWLGDSCDALYWPDDGPVDPEDPWAGLVAIGEGKSASWGVGREYGYEGSDDIPHRTLLQSHMHLIHWPEVDLCVVPVLVGGYSFEFRCYLVERDPEFEAILLEDLYEWHQAHIVRGEMPEPRCSDENWLMRRYPKALKGVMPETPELRELAWSKWRASLELKKWKQKECDVKQLCRQALGDFDAVDVPWGTFSWYNNAASFSVDWQSVANDAMDQSGMADEQRVALIAEHTSQKDGPRVLRVNVKKPFREEAEKEPEDVTEEQDQEA